MAEYITFDVQDGISVEKIGPMRPEWKERMILIEQVAELLKGVSLDEKKKILEGAAQLVEAMETHNQWLSKRQAQ